MVTCHRTTVWSTCVLGLWLTGCVNFHAVDPGRVYRAAQPTQERLRTWIDRHDIRTVVRLRGGQPGLPSYDATAIPTTEAGVELIEIPMFASAWPSQHQLLRLWEVFSTAQYPILLHCRAGADRTGLASAIYVLHKTGDIDAAKDQLKFFPYTHTGFGTWRLSRVFERYRPYQKQMSFPEWVERCYVPADETAGSPKDRCKRP